MSSAVIERVYANFNRRDIDAVLSDVDVEVEWENGMEGGFVVGHDALRTYWTNQWQVIDPEVTPLSIDENAPDEVTVKVHQTVRSLNGDVVSEGVVTHRFHFAGGRITRFEILSS